MRKVAVIGAGIAGLSAAYFLSRRHHVHLFEKADRLGGHTHTVVTSTADGPVALDTGFLVHNDRTYPRLVRLFRELGIETNDSDMCFGVRCPKTGFEYSSRGARGFFAQPANLLTLTHYRLLSDILRFNREAVAALGPGDSSETIGEFLESRRFSAAFLERYLLPMASAIWSASLAAIRLFPVQTLVRFLDNHGLLAINGQPKWKVVRNGSHTYIPLLTAPFRDRVHTGVAIRGILRNERAAVITFHDRPAQEFDDVVLACHGPEVLKLLSDPSNAEREVFQHFRTTPNRAWLHTDTSLLPRRPAARASWNYLLPDSEGGAPTVTYDLNRLQSLATAERFCVTLNPPDGLDERRVLRKMLYAHPLYTREAIRSQSRWREVSGVRRTHYCGAYWFYGFHEDGLHSALRVADTFGVRW